MQRFGLGGFAVTRPSDPQPADRPTTEESNVGGKEAATLLQDVLTQELLMQELRTLRGAYFDISGLWTGEHAFHMLKLIPAVYASVLEDAETSLRLFAALGDALVVDPFFAETAHLYINMALDLKLPQDAVDKAVRVAWQSIEAGRSYDLPSRHLQPPRHVSGSLLLTVASHSSPRLELLRRSAVAAGMDLRVEGMGMPWRGFGDKIFRTLEALQGVDDNTLVIFLDAFDTLLLPAAKDIARRFLWHGGDIIFGTEIECAHDSGLVWLYPPHLAAACAFLNSGTYAGRASDVRWMLDEVVEDLRRNHAPYGGDILLAPDQRWFTRFFLRHADSSRVVLDAGRTLFLTLHALPPGDLTFVPGDPALLRFGPTGGSPCILHGNGDQGKDTLDVLTEGLKAAGWPPESAAALRAAAAM
ncbi:unnamed protein product [Phaeothamnion confervicola]